MLLAAGTAWLGIFSDMTLLLLTVAISTISHLCPGAEPKASPTRRSQRRGAGTSSSRLVSQRSARLDGIDAERYSLGMRRFAACVCLLLSASCSKKSVTTSLPAALAEPPAQAPGAAAAAALANAGQRASRPDFDADEEAISIAPTP
jgi:hypothetical protein